jgi:predicted SAM-dependent methyltransferase
MKKALNIGCGSTFLEDWFNLDNSPNAFLSKIPGIRFILYKLKLISSNHYHVKWPKNIIYRDLSKKLPFSDNYLEYIYTSHCLEHLSKSNLEFILREIYRSLKPGGIVRIVLPDLKFYINEYVSNEGNPTRADIFMKGLNVINKSRDPHLWMYDKDSIKHKLISNGFQEIVSCNFKIGKCIDIDYLDNRPIDSLFIEAIKPL